MKKLLVLLMSATIAISSTIVSFAGEWKQDSVGWWYQNEDGSYVKNDWLTIGEEKYHFDSNGYMQTGLIEVNGVKHYLYTDGSLTYNWTTPEGYRVDADGRVLEDNTPGLNFSVVWATGSKEKTSDLILCRFINEGKEDIVVDPVVEVNTDGMIKKLLMYDTNTFTPCDYGIVPANSQGTDFIFMVGKYQQFTVNENTTLNFTVSCDSFVNSYYRIIPAKKLYRFHIEE